MTWGKALPLLVVCVVFDALRLAFSMFWFIGPALAAAYCTVKAEAIVGTTIAAALCTAGAATVGTLGVGVIGPFGIIVAMVVGLLGWLTVALWLMLTNTRIFKENTLWFAGSLLVSELPLIGAVPAMTVAVGRMYRHQIKTERVALKKFNEEQKSAQTKARQQQEMAILAMRTQQAANDDTYEREEIPENTREAA
jgi:hypothetical protein